MFNSNILYKCIKSISIYNKYSKNIIINNNKIISLSYRYSSSATSEIRKRESTLPKSDCHEILNKVPKSENELSEDVKKVLDGITKLTLVEVAELSHALQGIFNIPDSALYGGGGRGGNGSNNNAEANDTNEGTDNKKEEKTSFDIKLASFDPKSKIKVIKEIRTITGLGLKEAKELVEKSPSIIKKEIKKDEAEALINKLKEVGAVAEME